MSTSQNTLRKIYLFEGKGLHSGQKVRMRLLPAPENTGIRFLRKDVGDDAYIPAVVDYVTMTTRGTTLENNGIKVSTIEHVLSCLYALGVDNAVIELDNFEVPILDGSASAYVKAILADGLQTQNAPRKYYDVTETLHFQDEKTGADLVIEPCGSFTADLTIDFNSKVVGVQTFHFDENTDYASQIAPCRTFVFFHELEYLFSKGLIKGGDLENALVIVEHPVSEETVRKMAVLFNVKTIEVKPNGYLDNVIPHFDDECVRHKMLDMLGDFSLVGYRIRGRVIAYKSGHKVNTEMARLIRAAMTHTK
ncbi:MAG: UDP-3-O-[3-hydroxymyristoyl] N-acetylglucosamine deacetylase [Alistipes sp.]|nr:UDP-3-O-[3-hydroxymyristoyl] N-acetylglucosamine deacetylase [Candidatus Minthomonas equi]